MQNDKELEQLFKLNKRKIQDQGFSREVMNKLPDKIRILPQIIIVCFAVIGIILSIAIQGLSSFLESLNHIVEVSSQAEDISVSMLMPYLIGMLVLGSVGYAVYESDNV
ncbi:MAG: DUF5056 domain-containing protein [Tannerella sp.]|jgi:hypothetical protein|nr:DUF5056 domain-containing protein [Tannerella sp.]